MIEKVARSASFRRESPTIEGNYSVGASRQRSTREGSTAEGESTLLPMLIAGLVAVVVGITVAAFFV
jgi:hypothetical protein